MSKNASGRRRVLRRTAGFVCLVGTAGCLGGEPNEEASSQTQTDRTPETDATDDVPTSDTENGSPQSVSFEAPHGATIDATLYGSGDCGVVLVPQINKDRGSWKQQAEMIAELGHHVLAIDEDPDNRSASVRGAIQYFRAERDVSTLVLIGASSGGEAVVVANAKSDAGTVDGTITLSAGGGADRAANLHGRLLFVVSKNDDDRFVRVARQLHENAPGPKELVEYNGSAHGQGIFETTHGDDLRNRVRTLLSNACG